jgi:acyl-CoA reductase-like NAD-dependent aldehyde dehydrogenase
MQHPRTALILATGSARMVRAAYSSGTPAIGVGPGNAPAWICADAKLDRVAEMVVASKSFDNGILCASEHNLVVDAAIRNEFIDALERHGAAVLRTSEIPLFLSTLLDDDGDRIRPELTGQCATSLLQRAGIRREGNIGVVVVPTTLHDMSGPLGREKLAPVLSLFTVDQEEEGFAVCGAILAQDGAGHTAIIHTSDQTRIERFAREMRASRILVNAAGVQGTMGMTTGLVPSMTVGCGTFGGNSTTDNVTYTHLLNIKRVAFGDPASR